MDSRCFDLVNDIDRLSQELERTKSKLAVIQNTCNHDWDEKYTPVRTEAYTSPGDPPGTMGSDWRGPVHVPATSTKRWTRTCDKCGKEETTTSTLKKVETKESPRW